MKFHQLMRAGGEIGKKFRLVKLIFQRWYTVHVHIIGLGYLRLICLQ